MLHYTLNKQPGKPLYEELYKAIRNDILKGRLRSGQRLPSKRDMAADNNLSITTVLNAYQQLLMEGYLVSEEKKGYFVADLVAMPASEVLRTEGKPLYTEDNWFADFRSNNILYRHFPFAAWKKVLREILSDYDLELVKRANPFGLRVLREQIADYLYRVRGISVSPECIVIGAGIEYLYARLITLFPSSTIYAVENPGYQKISQIYQAYHLRWKSIAMDESGIYLSDLRAQDAAIVHVSPEHHYPLGTMMPMGRRQELLAWAAEARERYIIEDDFDCEFRYNSKPIPAMKSLDTREKVIYMNTFSKTLSPAVRVSYMVLPEHLAEQYISNTHFYTNTASSLEQYAVARFIEKGYFERHLNRVRKLYRQEGERLLKLLGEDTLIPIRKLSGGSSGTHLLIELDTDMTDAEVKQKAAEQGIYIACLSDYCSKNSQLYEHTLILNYSELDDDTQREAIRRLGTVFMRRSGS